MVYILTDQEFYQRILEVLGDHPEGLSLEPLREELFQRGTSCAADVGNDDPLQDALNDLIGQDSVENIQEVYRLKT